MSDQIVCHCGEKYYDAECFVAHYRECSASLQADNAALRARVAEHEEEMELFTAVAVMICQQESDEWDSDKVQTHKDYAEVCGQRISKLTPVSAKAWLLRKQAEAVERAADKFGDIGLGRSPFRYELTLKLKEDAQDLRTQADALERQSVEGGENP